MRLIASLAAVGCLVSVSASAQVVTAEILILYRQGATTPATEPIVLTRATRLCDQSPTPATALVVNPRIVEWDDPDQPGRACVWTDPGTGPLALLAADGVVYEAALRLRVGTVEGPEGPRGNPFTRWPVVRPRIRP